MHLSSTNVSFFFSDFVMPRFPIFSSEKRQTKTPDTHIHYIIARGVYPKYFFFINRPSLLFPNFQSFFLPSLFSHSFYPPPPGITVAEEGRGRSKLFRFDNRVALKAARCVYTYNSRVRTNTLGTFLRVGKWVS